MPTDILLDIQAPILFADTAQAEDVTLTLSALASAAGRVSARRDRGAGSQPRLHQWTLNWSLTGTNVLNAVVEIYCLESDGTYVEGGVATTDAAFASGLRGSVLPVGFARVYQTTTNVVMTAKGLFEIRSRYYQMAVWDATTLPFQTTTTLHQLYVNPLVDELQ
jgi:hypothetical protein